MASSPVLQTCTLALLALSALLVLGCSSQPVSEKTASAMATPTEQPPATPRPTETPTPEPPTPTPTPVPPTPTPVLTQSGPIVVDGESDRVIEGYWISNPSGDCVEIKNASRIVLRNVRIGPCQGRGVYVLQSQDIAIRSSTIEPGYKPTSCCDKGSGIYAQQVTGLTIEGNTVRRGETNVEIQASQDVRISGNRFENPLGPFPRGQQVQIFGTTSSARDILITSNSMYCDRAGGCAQEDAVNLYRTEDVTVSYNYIEGGFSKSGCGIISDNGANGSRIIGNRVLNSGNCGIGVASGSGHLVDANLVLLTKEVAGGGNVAVYAWRLYGTCGSVNVTNNIATFRRADGSHAGFWDGGGCKISSSNNVFGEAAYERLLDEFEIDP